jgi:hypothetical protein
MTAFIKTCQTFGSFVSQATEATHSTNYPQHSSATNFAALCRALDYDTLFSKSATSFLTRSRRHSLSPSPPNSATKLRFSQRARQYTRVFDREASCRQNSLSRLPGHQAEWRPSVGNSLKRFMRGVTLLGICGSHAGSHVRDEGCCRSAHHPSSTRRLFPMHRAAIAACGSGRQSPRP